MSFIRIIPVQRFVGLPAPAHRPFAFYTDFDSLYGRTIAECYRLVKGIALPPRIHYLPKESRTPYAWALEQHDIDAPLTAFQFSPEKQFKTEDYSLELLEANDFILLNVPWEVAVNQLDVFPATWRALAYIISDAGRMGAATLSWDMDQNQFARARIHQRFREIQENSKEGLFGGGLLAEQTTKEALGLTELWQLPEPSEELEYYHYLSKNSAFTNDIVELFGISHRCWHGCGYLGWAGFPLCRFFFLRNDLVPEIQISIVSGRDRLLHNSDIH